MMSLKQISLQDVVKRQYLFKLKSYFGVFGTLMLLQVVSLLLAFNGTSSFGSGSDSISVTISYYSADVTIAFTILWGIISSILLTTKAYRFDDYTFVANRLSSHLANILFIVTMSIVGGLTAMLSSFALRSSLHYFINVEMVKSFSLLDAPLELFVGIGATILYVLLASCVGYFVGTLVQFHKVLIVLIPVAFFGSFFITNEQGEPQIPMVLNSLLFSESSFPLFAVKVIVIAAILLVMSVVGSNRMGVR